MPTLFSRNSTKCFSKKKIIKKVDDDTLPYTYILYTKKERD